MKVHFIRLIILFIGLFGPIAPSFSQKISFEGSHTSSRIPFKLVQNLVIIELRINNSKPLNFLLDSGVGPLIITDSTLVDSLYTKDASLYRIQGRGIGPEIEAYLINALKVSIGKHASGLLTGILLKDEPFQLSNFLGMPIHGIIGSDFFTSFKVKLNYTHKRIHFYRFDAPMKVKGNRLAIQLIAGKPYADFQILKEDGSKHAQLLLIDTGAGHALSLDLKEQDMHLQPQMSISANLGIGLSGPIDGRIGRLKGLEFAGFTLKNLIAAFPLYSDTELHKLMTVQNGSVGGELLQRFTILFDYSQKALYLKRNRWFKKPFEYDMIGIEFAIVQGKNGTRFFVHRIEKDSPAERQGFRINDEILTVNFQDVKRYSLSELYGLFKKESKSGMIIQLRRGEVVLIKFLELKRRI